VVGVEMNSFSRKPGGIFTAVAAKNSFDYSRIRPAPLLFRLLLAYSGNFPEAMNFGRLQDNNMRKYLAT